MSVGGMLNFFDDMPEPFFRGDGVVVESISQNPSLTGINVGYEGHKWRYKAFAEHLIEWIPEFALRYSELSINSASAIKQIRKAARLVYNTNRYQKRGEFGELLLHAVIRELYNTQPVVSKVYYKSSANDPVKGFDAVHVVRGDDGELELWLGEVKFYEKISNAITDVCKEILAHVENSFLRSEFSMIVTKIDPSWPYAGELKDMLSEKRSLDTVFKRLCVPVLLTYESPIVKDYREVTEEFELKLQNELKKHYSRFCQRLPGVLTFKIHLFLVPLDDKRELVETLHKKLEGLQQ